MYIDKSAPETSKPAARRRRLVWRWLGLTSLLLGLAVAVFVWWLLPGTYSVVQDVQLPVRFADGLIYVEPETAAGAKLSFLADTGGGLYVTEKAVERTGMQPISVFGSKRTRLPALRTDAWIPEATGGEKWMPVFQRDEDGMLGQRWFAGGVWTFDYPAQKLTLRHQPFSPTTSCRTARVLARVRRAHRPSSSVYDPR